MKESNPIEPQETIDQNEEGASFTISKKKQAPIFLSY